MTTPSCAKDIGTYDAGPDRRAAARTRPSADRARDASRPAPGRPTPPRLGEPGPTCGGAVAERGGSHRGRGGGSTPASLSPVGVVGVAHHWGFGLDRRGQRSRRRRGSCIGVELGRVHFLPSDAIHQPGPWDTSTSHPPRTRQMLRGSRAVDRRRRRLLRRRRSASARGCDRTDFAAARGSGATRYLDAETAENDWYHVQSGWGSVAEQPLWPPAPTRSTKPPAWTVGDAKGRRSGPATRCLATRTSTCRCARPSTGPRPDRRPPPPTKRPSSTRSSTPPTAKMTTWAADKGRSSRRTPAPAA